MSYGNYIFAVGKNVADVPLCIAWQSQRKVRGMFNIDVESKE